MFKVIKDFPNYLIDSFGNVYNKKLIMRKSQADKDGYRCITLYREGFKQGRTIHSLVLEAFCSKRLPYMQINHIDSNRANNNLFNLEYVTASENMLHGYKYGYKCAVGENNGKAILTESDVLRIKKMLKTGGIAQWRIGKKFNIDQSTVSNIKTGKLWSHVCLT